ncbi:MAG TPA: mechanosensitive ion channel domain-containing protein [Stellaceae bacterium]|nr:mechanosensitive ion channel domain-containing protein [Stellaceae bacterium]
MLIRLAARFSPFLPQLLSRARGPAAAILAIIAVGAAVPAARLSYEAAVMLARGLLIAMILAIGWAAAIALNLGAELYVRRFRIDSEDNLLARKHVTQVRILRRAAQTLLVILTVSVALMTIPAVREYGLSLLASAGAAGLVIGLAARPVFTNLLAGIQIAVTQPIRVEDAVLVEGEYGWVETITSTYVVVRLWDLRRMVLPLTYFIEKPFQNWTYEGANLIGSVLLNVDYSVPVERVRQKLEEIVRSTPLWDGTVVNLQVTDTPGTMVQLRALVSARNAGQVWDLRCLVREQLIAFLQQEYPLALPRGRNESVTPSIPLVEPVKPSETNGSAPVQPGSDGGRLLSPNSRADTMPGGSRVE